MGFGGISGTTGDDGNITIGAMKEVAKEEALEKTAEQLESSKELQADFEQEGPWEMMMSKGEKTLKSQSDRIKESQKTAKGEKKLPSGFIKDLASQFEKKNPELKGQVLTLLREYVKDGDSKEGLLKKLNEFYPDVSLAEEALDFLLATSDGDLKAKLQEAKDEFTQRFSREITAGKNIAQEARLASEKGLGTPSTLRDLYRDVTGNPRESTALFEELSQKYAYKELKQVVDFLLHSLGADLKSKGPSIPRGMFHRLFTETRSLQAILGVYRFFRGRMHLMDGMFQKAGLEKPSNLTFEAMAKCFMSLAAERYPSSNKVLEGAVRLGLDKWLLAKIIALTQLRDAIREVAMNQVYRSVQHRDELYMAIIEALEDLEDELEELEEQLGEKEEGGQEKDDEEKEE